MKYNLLAGCLLIALSLLCLDRADAKGLLKPRRERKLTILPLPVIASNPTTGFMFGVAPTFNWTMGDPQNTTMSQGLVTAVYSTNKQKFLSARGNAFSSGDRWNFLTDFRYFINSQPTYGLGTGPQLAFPLVGGGGRMTENPYNTIPVSQMLEFNQVRIYQTALRRHKDTRYFYGVGYHLDMLYNIKDNLLDLNPEDGSDPVITHHYAYNKTIGFSPERYMMSGVSLNAAYDSRDNIGNPYTGRYIGVNFKINPTFLGSSKSSGLVWAEYRDYFPVSKSRPRHLIAVWGYSNFVAFGKVPYMFLPSSGGDMFGRSGRPYTQGRIRGEDLIYAETEYRFPLLKRSDRLGGVLFVNSVTASSRTTNINLFHHYTFGYGAGIRALLDPANKINLTVDYGFGQNGTHGFFFAVTEVF